mmetsp:Transcript_79186/g.222003  ORF Transcript_79186/g.222003 Transcript_79186/m.222003 type:complete len:269 (-) Transcript_79186:204-1010(-)
MASVFSRPRLKMRSLGLMPCSSAVNTANREPLDSQKKPFTTSSMVTMSTGMLFSLIRKISKFVANLFFVLLSFVTCRQRKSPSDCQCISASHCVLDREASSRREGISTSTKRAGLLSFSVVHTAMTLSFGDHSKVFKLSNFKPLRFPCSSGTSSKFSVSLTRIRESVHSAMNLASGLQANKGHSAPPGAACASMGQTVGVLQVRTHCPVNTWKIRTAVSSFAPGSGPMAPRQSNRNSSLGEKEISLTFECGSRTFLVNSGPAQRAMPC